MTKKQQREAQRAEWRKALAEGRVVRHNGENCLTSFLTVADAISFASRVNNGGGDAQRITVPLDQQAISLGLPADFFISCTMTGRRG